jgi:hypothetical protein
MHARHSRKDDAPRGGGEQRGLDLGGPLDELLVAEFVLGHWLWLGTRDEALGESACATRMREST